MAKLPKLWKQIVAALALAAYSGGLPAASSEYPNTIAAMQDRYADEVLAHQKYGAYAQRALDEGFPNIAHLFRALAASEGIHARNFKHVLEALGSEARLPVAEPQITTTRKHLQQATQVEADEIDNQYPEILERIRPEGYLPAIENTTWAWKAEQQHRALIIKIRDAATIWFGLLVDRIEGEPSHYHVCQICGSTLDKPPIGSCPICGHPAAEYREIPWVAAAAQDDPAAEPDGFQ